MVLKGNKWSQNVQFGLKRSSMFPNGPKWSLKFTINSIGQPLQPGSTWFLYGLKQTKFLTKKSPNWVRHQPGLLVQFSSAPSMYLLFILLSSTILFHSSHLQQTHWLCFAFQTPLYMVNQVLVLNLYNTTHKTWVDYFDIASLVQMFW